MRDIPSASITIRVALTVNISEQKISDFFWFLRTLKYADIYLKDYGSTIDASEGIGKYIEKYNMRRPHDSLEKRTPDKVTSQA